MDKIHNINDIDRTTKEGRLLFTAIIKLSTESQSDKQPVEILQQLEELASNIEEKEREIWKG